MHPSSVGSHDPVHFDELWSRVARLVPHAAMEDNRLAQARKPKSSLEQTAVSGSRRFRADRARGHLQAL